jgi:hypothetical protein
MKVQTIKSNNTKSWNPFVGCKFDCIYCKPSFKDLLSWLGSMYKYEGCKKYAPHQHNERLDRIPLDKAIFVCEDGDISFADPIFMKEVFARMQADKRQDRIWFVQSKNPKCLNQYLSYLPNNTYLVTTLETNRDDNYSAISQAPKPSQRYQDFQELQWDKKIVTVEPIMKFDLETFKDWIVSINPKAAFIGFNSKPNEIAIPEPSKKETLELGNRLQQKGIKVLYKDMRDPTITKKAYKDLLDGN